MAPLGVILVLHGCFDPGSAKVSVMQRIAYITFFCGLTPGTVLRVAIFFLQITFSDSEPGAGALCPLFPTCLVAGKVISVSVRRIGALPVVLLCRAGLDALAYPRFVVSCLRSIGDR